MKKIFSKIFILTFVFIFLLSSCSNNNPTEYNPENEIQLDTTHISKVEDANNPNSDNMIVKDGSTAYTLVYSANKTPEDVKAVSYLQTFFYEATGLRFAEKTDAGISWSEKEKYISVGNNALKTEAEVTYDYPESKSGFQIKTKGNTIFLVGGQKGVIYAAQELLNYWFGFDYFAENCYSLERGIVNLPLKKYEITEIPDIEYRLCYTAKKAIINSSDSFYKDGLRLNEDPLTGFYTASHNTFFLVPPQYPIPEGTEDYYGINSKALTLKTNEDGSLYINPNTNNYELCNEPTNYLEEHPEWFSEGTNAYGLPAQLCFSRDPDGLIDIMLPKIVYWAIEYPAYDTFMVSHQDTWYWCSCETCQAYKQAYGEDSAAYLIFINKLAERLKEWQKTDERLAGRTLEIMGMIYHANENAPTHYDEKTKSYVFNSPDLSKVKNTSALIHGTDLPELYLRDDVVLLYVESIADKNFNLNHETNKAALKNLESWGSVAKKLMTWNYNMAQYSSVHTFQFSDYYDNMQHDYKLYVKNHTYIMLEEGNSVSICSGFQVLRAYLAAKLQWNCQIDFNACIERFFDNYFGPVSQQMKNVFLMARSNMRRLADSGQLPRDAWDLLKKEYYSESFLKTQLKEFDMAYGVLEELKATDPSAYKTYYDRVLLESICWRFTNLYIYADSYNSDELKEMRTQFKNDCTKLNITKGGLNLEDMFDIGSLWESWGV